MLDFFASSHGMRFLGFAFGLVCAKICGHMIDRKEYGQAATVALIAIGMFSL